MDPDFMGVGKEPLELQAAREGFIPFEQLANHTLYAPCGCKLEQRGEEPRRSWVFTPCGQFYRKLEPCDKCELWITAIPGAPFRWRPCQECRRAGKRPNFCWAWKADRTLHRSFTKPEHGYWPPMYSRDHKQGEPFEVPPGDALTVASQVAGGFPSNRAVFNVLRLASETRVPLVFYRDENREADAPGNAARRAHNHAIEKRGRCAIPGCPHRKGKWGPA